MWNTATQITQTWDWETVSWTPSSESSYNTYGSTSECRFKCDSNFFWDGFECLNPCKPNPCNSIGETGICVGESANEYICECEENYFLNGSSHCLNPCEPNPCTGIGETGICLGKSANEYICECEENYEWNSSSNKCKKKNPCLNNPCNIPNSTGTCNTVSETQYTCECEDNYFWDSSTKKCVNPCDPNPCTAITNSVCTATDASKFSCSGGTDPETGLTWSARASSTMTWSNAGTYCDNLTEGGYSDWHLPTIDELKTLLIWSKASSCKVSETNNCLAWDGCWTCSTCTEKGTASTSGNSCSDWGTSYSDGRYSKLGDGAVYLNLWSSSTRSDSTSYAWLVSFSYGSVGYSYKANDYDVRCVR